MEVSNVFDTYQAGSGHCCRIRGIETTTISHKQNGSYWWDQEAVVLPFESEQEIEFTHVTSGHGNISDRYVATAAGVFKL